MAVSVEVLTSVHASSAIHPSFTLVRRERNQTWKVQGWLGAGEGCLTPAACTIPGSALSTWFPSPALGTPLH